MIRKAILTLGMLAMAAAGFAQINYCATDEIHRALKASDPSIEAQEKQLEADIAKYVKGRFSNPNAKTTAGVDTPWTQDTRQFHIPVVVHIIYDYAASNSTSVADNEVYGLMTRLNKYYNKANADLSGIIAPYVPYIGNAHIDFQLATKDPNGRPTRGIVRSYSYLANGGDNSAKIDVWPPDQYLNIYFENVVGSATSKGVILAFAYYPTDYASNPYAQGVISRADQAFASPNFGDPSTIAHEIGHYLSLKHPWESNGQDVEGTTGKPVVCGDDEVDDTPPTIGHFSCTNVKLYDTFCAKGYYKDYDGQTAYHMFGDSSATSKHKDYPDTTNSQNIMDYSHCNNQMFTKGQVARMRATLRSAVGFRSNVVSNTNLSRTGIWDTLNDVAIAPPDIAPTADFSVNRPFVCANSMTSVTFTNRSYNDTITSAAWTFGANADNQSINSPTNLTTATNTFNTPGWVDVSLTATGNNTGSNTIARNRLVYAADTTAKNPFGYFEDFNPGGDLDKYPIFNYYGNDFKWELVNNAGVYDNTSIRYVNYDDRTVNSSNATLTPGGSYADFYTPAFDLTVFGAGMCNLSFFSAGAFRTSMPSQMNDVMEVSASNDCGQSWKPVGSLTGADLGNNGLRTDRFTPNGLNEWKEQSINVPVTVRQDPRTYFRFRFTTGTNYPNSTGFAKGTGNNFYLDRISVTNAPLGVKNGVIVNLGMSVSPNPTSGAATVRITGGDNSIADLSVTDVTGKVVYRSSITRTSVNTKVEIPAAALAVKGMYLVKVVTNGATETQKLVVY